jgi:hypothetical protein
MTDFLDRLERQLVLAAAAPLPASKPVAREARRLTPLGVGVAALVVGGAVALAASGVLTGAPVKPTGPLSPTVGSGIPARGGSRILPLRAADPAGGLPWGVRIVDTTRGYVCLQVGRVQNGQLGELGTDGAFHDDGRFHPIPPDILPLDGEIGNDPQCALPGEAFTTSLFDFDSNAAPPDGQPVPPRDQREIAFGLLGRHALSVTYATARGHRTIAVNPGTGAFLFVQRPAKPGGQYSTGSGPVLERDGVRPYPNGALTAITYRFGSRVCSDSVTFHSPHACPRPHLAKPPSSAQANLHQALHVTLDVNHGVVNGAQLTFSAPYAVTNASETYAIEEPLAHDCHNGGVLGSNIERDIARGAIVRVSLGDPFVNSCNHSQTIKVVFSRVTADVGPSPGTVIGSITIHQPPGTRNPRLPSRRRTR